MPLLASKQARAAPPSPSWVCLRLVYCLLGVPWPPHPSWQAMRRFPGQIPDLDAVFMFPDVPCFPREAVYPQGLPPPVFGINGHAAYADIPFPDYSFWGAAPSLALQPVPVGWAQQQGALQEAAQVPWPHRAHLAVWRGLPAASSPRLVQANPCLPLPHACPYHMPAPTTCLPLPHACPYPIACLGSPGPCQADCDALRCPSGPSYSPLLTGGAASVCPPPPWWGTSSPRSPVFGCHHAVHARGAAVPVPVQPVHRRDPLEP